MEWKNTKWVRGKFFEISAIILGILAIVVLFGFAIQQGNAMLALTGCGITNISCVLFRSTLLVCIILAGGYILFLLIAFTLDLVIKTQLGIPNILSWFRTPKSVNLNLSVGSVYANEHTLKFSSKEWRYPFQYMALIAVAKFDHGREAGGLEWRKL